MIETRETDVILLAISYKHGGLCVAGIDYNTHEYIRLCNPVDCFGPLPFNWDYGTGLPFILDIIHVKITAKPVVSGSQCENYGLYESTYVGEFPREKLGELYDSLKHSKYVFGNSANAVSHADAVNIKRSLELFKVINLKVWHIVTDHSKKHYASFDYNNVHYSGISLTDCIYCAYPKRFGVDPYAVNGKDAYIMVSMPGNDEKILGGLDHYKWVAGIIRTNHKRYCIRCGRVIPRNPSSIPYCEHDYQTWSVYSNRNYIEKNGVCYNCGASATVSMNQPCCFSCSARYQDNLSKRQ